MSLNLLTVCAELTSSKVLRDSGDDLSPNFGTSSTMTQYGQDYSPAHCLLTAPAVSETLSGILFHIQSFATA